MAYGPTPEGWDWSDPRPAYRVFTLYPDRVETGAELTTIQLRQDGTQIAAIRIGEEGRYRSVGVLPVLGAPPGCTRVSCLRVTGSKAWKRPPIHQKALSGGGQSETGYLAHYATEASDNLGLGEQGAILVCRFDARPVWPGSNVQVTGDYDGQLLILPEAYERVEGNPELFRIDTFHLDYAVRMTFTRERLNMSDAEFDACLQLPEYDELMMVLAEGRVAHGAAGRHEQAPQYILLQSPGRPIRVVQAAERVLAKHWTDDEAVFYMLRETRTGMEVVRLTDDERTEQEDRGRAVMPRRPDKLKNYIL